MGRRHSCLQPCRLLRLRHQVHTFVAFIDSRKGFDSCWVEPTLVRPWVDSGVAQGRVLSPLLFNLLVDSLATSLPVPGVRLVDPDPFRHVCQLCADDLVILAESQAHLQHPLDRRAYVGSSLAVLVWHWPHQVGGYGLRSSPRPPRLFRPSWGRLSPFGATIHLGVTLTPTLSLGVLTLTWSALVVIASSTKLALGVVAKVCLSLSPHLSSLRPFQFVIWSGVRRRRFRSISNSTSRSVAGAVIFLGGPMLLLSQQYTGSLASAMHSALPSDVHSLCLVACVPWTTLPLALQKMPVSSGSVRPCKAHGRIGERPLFDPFQSTLAFLWFPSFGRPTLALSRSHSPLGPRPAPQACSHGFRHAWPACRCLF